MKKEKVFSLIKIVLIMIVISVIIETALMGYHFIVIKLYKKMHFVENKSIEIKKDDIKIEENNGIYLLKVKNEFSEKIYNISLFLKSPNNDVYMRVLFNNNEKFIPKENSEASKFKVYFISGIEANEFAITFSKSELQENKIDKIIINDNLNYVPEIKFSTTNVFYIFCIVVCLYIITKLYRFSNGKEIPIKKEFIFLWVSLTVRNNFCIY